MFPPSTSPIGFPGRRRGLTTFRALWPDLRFSLIELQERAQLDWVKPQEDPRLSRWAHLAAKDRLLDRETA